MVIGDIMLDRYIFGDVKRISNEAPVPIVHVKNTSESLGGCGNVVRNIRELGAQVSCIASIAWDIAGNQIIKQLKNLNVDSHLSKGSEVTIIKERIIADERKIQMLRLDREKKIPNPHLVLQQLQAINLKEEHYDMIVISDYAKGVITKPLMNYVNQMKIPVIVDPKPQNKHLYGRPLLMTPNEYEFLRMGGCDGMKSQYILETLGKKGMILYSSRDEYIIIPSAPVEVYNVSGAGDVVISVMAVCMSLGLSLLKSAKIANDCAGYTVTFPETSVIPKNKFKKFLEINNK